MEGWNMGQGRSYEILNQILIMEHLYQFSFCFANIAEYGI